MGAIVGMAQDFVGSNNSNSPQGQFGTRLLGAKYAASPRYIFAQLMPMVENLVDKHDDPLLKYYEDDGQTVEPELYVPTLPYILFNGCEGIGTGYSTQVPWYTIENIETNIVRMLKNEPLIDLIPWYKGFTGKIENSVSSISYIHLLVVKWLMM